MMDQPQGAQVPIHVPEATPYFSPTGVRMGLGRWACQLVLTSSIQETPGADHPEAVIALSWPLAKALHAILGLTIADFERQEGPVGLPRSFLANLEAIAATSEAEQARTASEGG